MQDRGDMWYQSALRKINAQLRRAYSATCKLSEVRRIPTMRTPRLPKFSHSSIHSSISASVIRNSANFRPESIDGHKLIQSGCLHFIAEIGF